jgi:hypothetical protein
VPLFKQEIQRPVERFLQRVAPGKAFMRANWGVTARPELFQPPLADHEKPTPEALAADPVSFGAQALSRLIAMASLLE